MSEIGRVTAVKPKSDENTVYLDVGMSPNRELSGIEFRQPAGGFWIVPAVGDIVEVVTVGNDEKIAVGKRNNADSAMPSGLAEGDIAIEVGDGTVLRFDSENGDVTLTCSGDLNLDAANIFVGDSSNAEAVATGSHTHSESDGGTTSGPSDTTTHKME